MNEPFFRRCQLFVVLGAASLALAACGGSAGGDGAVAADPQVRTSALGETDADDAADVQRPGDVVAADAGAASREPQ